MGIARFMFITVDTYIYNTLQMTRQLESVYSLFYVQKGLLLQVKLFIPFRKGVQKAGRIAKWNRNADFMGENTSD